MATVSEKSAELAVGEWAPSDAVDEKVDRYLAKRLASVGSDYKSVVVTTFLLGAGVGLVLWLAAGVIADHWLVPGGLGRTPRLAWLVIGAVALVASVVRWIVPLVRYRVNLVYAARSIERANPELRNDVVNTVLVRASPERTPPVVVTSLEHRTAKRLSKLPADIVTDRSMPLRLAAALAVLVALACLYAVFSPKSLFTTAARLAAPWARIAPPTRVQIAEPEIGWRLPAGDHAGGDDSFHPIPVKDGMATIIRNRQLVVRSRIRGLSAGEQPAIEASGVADDGAIDHATAWRTRLEPAADGGFEAMLPGGGHGLSNDLVVTVAAGDARSEPVRVVVVDAPSLLVRQLKLVPPAYTRREPELLEWQGDVSGLEGTTVTLLAESKDPLEMAAIDFGCDGQGLLRLKIDPRDLTRASGSFDLRLSPDRSGPWERNYQLVFRPRGMVGDDEGRPRGIEHRINVVADTMPEVRIVDPAKPVVKVPPEKPVAVGVEAIDPDFALRSVAIELELERNGERMPRPAQPILDREFTGQFRGHAVFKPASVGGRGGDRLHYRAVAVDSKMPSPNAARTEWFSFELDAAAPPRPVPPSAGRPGQPSAGQAGSERSEGAAAGGDRGDAGGQDRENNDGKNSDGKNEPSKGGAGESPKSESQEDGGQGPQQGGGQGGSGATQQGGDGSQSKGRGGSSDGATSASEQGSGEGGESDAAGSSGSGGNGSGGSGSSGSKGGSDGSHADGKNGDGRGGSDAQGGNDSQAGNKQKEGGRQAGSEQAGGQQAGNQQGPGDDPKGESRDAGNRDRGNRGSGEQREGGREQRKEGPGEGAAAAGDQPGGERSGQRSDRDKPVSSDGTNDGEAIERILEQRSREGREQSGSNEGESSQQGESSQRGEKGPAGNQGQRGSDGQRGNEQQAAGSKAADGKPADGKQDGDQQPGAQSGADQQAGSQSGGGKKNGDQKGGDQKGDSKGDSKGDGSGNDSKQQGKSDGNEGEPGGGQPTDGGGEAGEKARGQQSGGEQGGPQQGGPQQGGPQQGGKDAGSGQAPGGGRDGQKGGAGAGGEAGAGGSSGGDDPESQSGGKDSSRTPDGGKQGDADAGRAGEDLANDDPASKRKPSEQAGAGGRGRQGLGGWDAGDGGGSPQGEAATKEAEWGEENLSHARNAVDLAVEHLKRSMDEGRTDVLDSLGWTREQAQAFLDRWTRMAQSAQQGGPPKQREFDRAVRSLGLTPQGVRRSRETVEDVRGGQAEGRRSQPPPEYREQFRAFTQGVEPAAR